MSILDDAKGQFAEKLQAVGEFFVEPWGEKGTTVYFRASTMRERADIIAKSKGGDLDIIIESIIARVRDENGDPLFKRANKPELMRDVDPDILSDIVIAMGKFDLDLKESVGN